MLVVTSDNSPPFVFFIPPFYQHCTRTSPAGRGAPRRRKRTFDPQNASKCPYKHSKTTRIDYQDFTLKWISGQEKLCVKPRDSSSKKIHRWGCPYRQIEIFAKFNIFKQTVLRSPEVFLAHLWICCTLVYVFLILQKKFFFNFFLLKIFGPEKIFICRFSVLPTFWNWLEPISPKSVQTSKFRCHNLCIFFLRALTTIGRDILDYVCSILA